MSEFCGEPVDGASADRLSAGEALGECAALLLAVTLEGDGVAPGDATVASDAVGWDPPGVEGLVRVSSTHS